MLNFNAKKTEKYSLQVNVLKIAQLNKVHQILISKYKKSLF